MAKFYLTNWEDIPHSSNRLFSLDNHRESGLPCGETRTQAEKYCLSLNRAGIKVELLKGGTHICSDFQVEEVRPKQFVAYCDVSSAIKAFRIGA